MLEKEYIERDSLVGLFLEKCFKDTSSTITYGDVIQIINAHPRADVQEVRHGKNVTTEHPVDEFVCSECGIIFEDVAEYIPEEDIYREFHFKLCPNCGAKIRE